MSGGQGEASQVEAVVRSVEGEVALVEVLHRGCGRCDEPGGCGGQHLTQMFCSGPRQWRVDHAGGYRPGERVLLALPAGSVRRTANLAYGLPLAGLLVGAMAGLLAAGEPGSIGGGLLGVGLGWWQVRRRSHAEEAAFARPAIVGRAPSTAAAVPPPGGQSH